MNSSGTANENVICVDKLWLNFKSAFLKVADRHAPLLQKRVRGVDNCPWMTGQIKKDIRQRDYFLKKARKSSRDEDWLAYKSMRNRVTNSVKRAKQTYNKKLIDNHKDDTKAFWRTMKKIIPGNKSFGGSKNVNIDGVLCSEASHGKKTANDFNKFFASAAVRLKRALGNVSFKKRSVDQKVNGSIPNFQFELINESLVVKTLQGLKASKASGLDNISPRMLKDAAVVVAKPLTRIVIESLSQGTVPSEWKYAKITPLYKKGMSTDMDNYRPISVLPVVSKVLERVVHHQLHSFLSEHKLLNPFQCGFRRNHSTESTATVFSDYTGVAWTLDCSLGRYLLTCARYLTLLITKFLLAN